VKVDIDFSELSKLAQELITQTPKQAKAAARKVTTAQGRLVKSRARSAAPKDRPWLAGAIRSKAWNNPDSVATSVYAEATDPEGRPVAFVVEYGTSKMPPQPFMEPAIAPAHESYPAAVLAAIDPFEAPGGDGGGGDE
jgi:HK97 gp10 family phage protein